MCVCVCEHNAYIVMLFFIVNMAEGHNSLQVIAIHLYQRKKLTKLITKTDD